MVSMDSTRRIALAALAGAAVAAGPALGADTPPTTTDTTTVPNAGKTVTLSNRTTFTRWAYTNLTLKVRKKPSAKSKAIGKLHFNTEDRPPEIYLALKQY